MSYRQPQQIVYVQAPPQSNAFGAASLTIGILQFFTCGLLAPIGLLCGFIGLTYAPRGSATAGLILNGILGVPLLIVAGTFFLGAKARDKYQEVQSQLTQQVPNVEPQYTASTSAQTANARVSIVEVKIEKPTYTTTGSITPQTYQADEEQLCVTILIENTSTNKKLDYLSWRLSLGLRSVGAVLTDEHANSYAAIEDSPLLSRVPVSGVKSQSLAPGESCQDLLIFEKPIKQAKELLLELPGERIGGSDPIKLRFEAPPQN